MYCVIWRIYTSKHNIRIAVHATTGITASARWTSTTATTAPITMNGRRKQHIVTKSHLQSECEKQWILVRQTFVQQDRVVQTCLCRTYTCSLLPLAVSFVRICVIAWNMPYLSTDIGRSIFGTITITLAIVAQCQHSWAMSGEAEQILPINININIIAVPYNSTHAHERMRTGWDQHAYTQFRLFRLHSVYIHLFIYNFAFFESAIFRVTASPVDDCLAEPQPRLLKMWHFPHNLK